MYILNYNTEIACSHQLPNAYNEKCHNLHGHTYKVSVEIERETLINDVVIDFKLLKDIIEELDHKHLNDFLPVPTTERLAEYLHKKIENELPSNTIINVEIFESDKSSIIYKL